MISLRIKFFTWQIRFCSVLHQRWSTPIHKGRGFGSPVAYQRGLSQQSRRSISKFVFDLAPASIKPYLLLSRFDKPSGILLVYWPVTWGIFLACHVLNAPLTTGLFYSGSCLVGALATRSASCIINDLWDYKIDKEVARTKDRLLAAGILTKTQAVGWLVCHFPLGLVSLACLNSYACMYALAAFGLMSVYPYLKRITHYPQSVLGLAMNAGVFVGWSAISGDIVPLSVAPLSLSFVLMNPSHKIFSS